MAAFAVRAAISARVACPALPKRRVGSGRRDSAAATEARAAADEDQTTSRSSNAATSTWGTSAAFLATATTRRRLAVAVAAALALEPAIPRSSAGALTDLVKNSGVGGPNLGLVEFDSPDLDYSFFYPKGWKVLRNRLRRGVIVSDFDAPVGNPKVYVEVVSAPPRASSQVTHRSVVTHRAVTHPGAVTHRAVTHRAMTRVESWRFAVAPSTRWWRRWRTTTAATASSRLPRCDW